MNNLIRFTLMILALIVAGLLILAVGGVLSSSQLWHNLSKILELIAIIFITSALIILLGKK